MKYLLSLAFIFCAAAAQAELIERACISSERSGGNRSLCGCMQDAADMTLTRPDQQLAARFFSKPDLAQQIRQSNAHKHENFWQRYRDFGETAEAFCRS